MRTSASPAGIGKNNKEQKISRNAWRDEKSVRTVSRKYLRELELAGVTGVYAQ